MRQEEQIDNTEVVNWVEEAFLLTQSLSMAEAVVVGVFKESGTKYSGGTIRPLVPIAIESSHHIASYVSLSIASHCLR